MRFVSILATIIYVNAVTSGPARENDIVLAGCPFNQTFLEDFHNFQVTAWQTLGHSWTAHTPWAGDFGDAAFANPTPSFPFTVKDNVLRIEARKNAAGKWQSGLLSSADSRAVGFSQLYGYFEMRAKLPSGDGLWPAFWLGTNTPRGAKGPGVEIDVIEHYGRAPGSFNSNVHVWNQPPLASHAVGHTTDVPPGSLYSSFHRYGADVERDTIVFYLDRKEIWRTPTPPEHQKPLRIFVNLALGSGWPIDKAPNPSIMEVSDIRVFSPASNGCNTK